MTGLRAAVLFASVTAASHGWTKFCVHTRKRSSSTADLAYPDVAVQLAEPVV